MVASRGIEVSFGSHGMRAITEGRVTSNQIEAARRVLSRSLGKTGKVWTRIFPDHPFTKKPAEVKMGKGKGELQGYQVQVWPGRILFEVDGADDVVSREAIRKAGSKLPVKVKVAVRH